jgi:hypothetical protein
MTKPVDFKLAFRLLGPLELGNEKVTGLPEDNSDAGPKVGYARTWSSSLREVEAATTTGMLATMRLMQSYRNKLVLN